MVSTYNRILSQFQIFPLSFLNQRELRESYRRCVWAGAESSTQRLCLPRGVPGARVAPAVPSVARPASLRQAHLNLATKGTREGNVKSDQRRVFSSCAEFSVSRNSLWLRGGWPPAVPAKGGSAQGRWGQKFSLEMSLHRCEASDGFSRQSP